MEKEQKKLLLVAVSTGVFLLVTITVAIIMLTPKIQPQDAVFSSAVPFQAGTIKPVETVNDTSSQPVINNSQETKIYIDGTPEPITIDKNNGDSLTIQIPKPSTPAVPDNSDISVSSTAKTQTSAATTVKTASTQPAKVQTTAVVQTGSTSKTATASLGKTAAKTITDYWIQTGAYSSMVRAEDVKERLSSSGLTSIIENREVDGKILYRVRLGPYTSENEANYWLSLVKSIDNFGDSQVRQTVRQQ
jgi:DedD protein